MSYEGAVEYLCESGHYHVIDVGFFGSGEWPEDATFKIVEGLGPICVHCQRPMVWTHEIDYTNGRSVHPDTYPAEREEVGFTDVPHVDHYNNRYYTKLHLYVPAQNSAWRRIADIEAETERERAEMAERLRFTPHWKCSRSGHDFFIMVENIATQERKAVLWGGFDNSHQWDTVMLKTEEEVESLRTEFAELIPNQFHPLPRDGFFVARTYLEPNR